VAIAVKPLEIEQLNNKNYIDWYWLFITWKLEPKRRKCHGYGLEYLTKRAHNVWIHLSTLAQGKQSRQQYDREDTRLFLKYHIVDF
jgi:cobalamin-dependent methionine synthase I